MDWARARLILLVAFTAVNLSLAYLIWGESARGLIADRGSSRVERDQLRVSLLQRGVELDPAVVLPPTPQPMRFLRVVHQPATLPPDLVLNGAGLSVDSQSGLIGLQPAAQGAAARGLNLENRGSVTQFAQEYGKSINLLPPEAQVSGIYPQAGTGFLRVEFTPVYNGLPVFAGFVWIDLSTKGVETISRFWVIPEGLKEGTAKAVRPAQEALLRVADQLQATKAAERRVVEVRLGYYAVPVTVGSPTSLVRAWDTVPVWQVRVADGRRYYVNAFNGQLEN
ncbi:MAG TPA: hypothetical protein VK191_06735 [Symbiobacteriaceae bacterium]|nr:hypothetical protein [Symbiobacteriaceae bacterium]